MVDTQITCQRPTAEYVANYLSHDAIKIIASCIFFWSLLCYLLPFDVRWPTGAKHKTTTKRGAISQKTASGMEMIQSKKKKNTNTSLNNVRMRTDAQAKTRCKR